jgi:dihydroxyacetone kinase-like protein
MRYQASDFRGAFAVLSEVMAHHRDELGELDAQNGDGDLGVSMSAGYAAVAQSLGESTEDDDLGRLLLSCGKVFNEASPSSLGTITSFGLLGMAKALRGMAVWICQNLRPRCAPASR